MKTKILITFIFFLCIPFISNAQDDTMEVEETIISVEDRGKGDSAVVVEIGDLHIIISDNDDVKIKRKGREGVINSNGIKIKGHKEPKKFETKFGAIGLGLVNFEPEKAGPEVVEATIKSADVHWAIVRQQYNFSRYVSLNWALDMNWRNYRFDQNVIFTKDPTTGVYGTYFDSTISYSKNKLLARYIGIPLMLYFHTAKLNSWKTFGFAIGPQFSQFLGAKQKLVSSEHGKQKKNGSYGFSPQRIDILAELMLGRITLYGQYGITPMFRAVDVDYGSNYTPYSFGVKLIGF